MKIAYLILAHCEPKLLHCAVDELVRSGDVYIHINNKVNIIPFVDEFAVYKDDKRVSFVKERINVNWGGFSILKATFSALGQCLQIQDYDRIILLTGLDFPIKSHEFILYFFEKNKDLEFVNACVKTGKARLLKFHAYFDNKLWFKFCRLLPGIKLFSFLGIKKDYISYQGQKHLIYGIAPKWALTGKTARMLLKFFYENNEVNHYIKSTYGPDDYYVATVVRILGVPEDKICTTPIFFEQQSSQRSVSVNILTSDDYGDICKSGGLYARKFGFLKSAKLISQLKDNVFK